jgi:hypothetical protein
MARIRRPPGESVSDTYGLRAATGPGRGSGVLRHSGGAPLRAVARCQWAQCESTQQLAGRTRHLVNQHHVGHGAEHDQPSAAAGDGPIGGPAPVGKRRETEKARGLHVLEHQHLAVECHEANLGLACQHAEERWVDRPWAEASALRRERSSPESRLLAARPIRLACLRSPEKSGS